MREKKSELWIKAKRPILCGIIAALLCAGILFVRKANTDTDKVIIPNVDFSEEMQALFDQVSNNEIQGAMLSMFSLDSYDVSNIETTLGIQAVKLEEQLEDGDQVLAVTNTLLEKGQNLDRIFIGLKMNRSVKVEGGLRGGLYQMFKNASVWNEQLFKLIKRYPEKTFYIILEYPSAYEIEKLSEIEKNRLYKWYYDQVKVFAGNEIYPNIKVFMPETAKGLVLNKRNYLENGEPNAELAGLVLREIIGIYKYEVTESTFPEAIQLIRETEQELLPDIKVGEEHTYVFFGDSVIGNFTDSMSIPGVVQGMTGADVINCGYGGLAAAKKDDEGLGLYDIIQDFFSGKYEHLPDNKPIKTGIPTFYDKLLEMNTEKLTFFISIGLNDYMSGRDLESKTYGDIYTYKGALEYAVEALKKQYPKCEIILMTPNFLARENFGTDRVNGYTMEELVDTILAVGAHFDIKCIDVFHEVPINKDNYKEFIPDLCHPNEFGRYEIGKLIYEHLLEWNRLSVAASGPAWTGDYGNLTDQFENLEKNAFFDSLVYTGYNIEKHRSDGLMWEYVLASQKRGKGWLSDITYNGGSTGYETAEGVPDISFFEENGLVCASYATYVYFNYLPNIAGADTSELAQPVLAYNANDWYVAAKQWVEEGYSETVDFEASLKGGFIDFSIEKEIPIGSIIAFCDARNKSDYCSHIVIYAGYENGYHWVYHVGNENGPEFCAVQRMHFGPDPQWPIAVITTPNIVIEGLNN